MSKFSIRTGVRGSEINIKCLDKGFKHPEYKDNTVVYASAGENSELFHKYNWDEMSEYEIIETLDKEGILSSLNLTRELYVEDLNPNHPLYVDVIDNDDIPFEGRRNHLANINLIDGSKPYCNAMLNFVSGHRSKEDAIKDFEYCGFKFEEIHDYWKSQTTNTSTGSFRDFYDELHNKDPGYLMSKNMILENQDSFSIFIDGREYSSEKIFRDGGSDISDKLKALVNGDSLHDYNLALNSAEKVLSLFPNKENYNFSRIFISEVFKEIAKSPTTTLDVQKRILDNPDLKQEDNYVFADLAKESRMSEELFNTILLRHGDDHFIVSRLAENQSLSTGQLEHLLHGYKNVSEMSETFGGKRSYSFMLKGLAENLSSSSVFLDEMSTELSKYITEELLSDNYSIAEVLACVAENPNVSSQTLDFIIKQDIKGLVGQLEKHKTAVLQKTRNMEHIEISLQEPFHNSKAKAMASNLNIEPEYLTKVIQKYGQYIDFEALKNPNLNDEHFRILAHDKNRNFTARMKTILKHEAVSRDVIENLTNDSRQEVAELACAKLKFYDKVISMNPKDKIQCIEDIVGEDLNEYNFTKGKSLYTEEEHNRFLYKCFNDTEAPEFIKDMAKDVITGEYVNPSTAAEMLVADFSKNSSTRAMSV